LMTWDELRQLDPALVTLGSHSFTHPILSTLTGAELAVELVESRRLLEHKGQRTVEFFCYPNGAHSPEVVRLARAHYRAACATEPGFVLPDSDRHQLPRIGSAPRLPYFAWRLHRPGA
jgi:peptidoglycan/xylan/chitin deacetylase (PgdA/CDA1 family)